MIVRKFVIFIVITIFASSSAQYKWADNDGNTYEVIVADLSKPNYYQKQSYYNQNRPNYANARPRQPRVHYPNQQYVEQYPKIQIVEVEEYPKQQYVNQYPKPQYVEQQYPQQQYSQNRYPQQQYSQNQYAQHNNQQEYPGFHNPQYTEQQTPSFSTANAEWVCTNQRTKDVMILTAEEIFAKVNELNKNINNPEPSTIPVTTQEPTIWTTIPVTTQEPTIWTTTQETKKPTTTTTERPIWADIFPGPNKEYKPNWPVGNSNSQPGLIVVDPTPASSLQKTTKGGDSLPGFSVFEPMTPTYNEQPTTATEAPDYSDDDEPIKIEFGK